MNQRKTKLNESTQDFLEYVTECSLKREREKNNGLDVSHWDSHKKSSQV